MQGEEERKTDRKGKIDHKERKEKNYSDIKVASIGKFYSPATALTSKEPEEAFIPVSTQVTGAQ